MQLPIFKLDSFTTRLFAGNPAAVVLMEQFLDDSMLKAIAAENNLSETAFLVRESDGDYSLRWFTPAVEVPLCGHATLAAAAVVLERLDLGRDLVVFHSASGKLTVTRTPDGAYIMDFPARPCSPVQTSADLVDALGIGPLEVLINPFCYLVLLDSAEAVRKLSPDFAKLATLDRAGIIVTSAGDETYDFFSRYFAPAKGVNEDPVTGGAHCSLAPYWSKRLNKTELCAFQASSRGGELRCRVNGDRVELRGCCVFYLEGKISIG